MYLYILETLAELTALNSSKKRTHTGEAEQQDHVAADTI